MLINEKREAAVKRTSNEKRYLHLAREVKNVVEHRSNGETNCNCHARMVHKVLLKCLEEFEDRGQEKTFQATALLRLV